MGRYKKSVESIFELITKVAEDKTINIIERKGTIDFIVEASMNCSKYVQATNDYVFIIHSISESRTNGIISQDEFTRQLQSVDLMRRSKHNALIDACNQLNRQCDLYKIERFCPVDTRDRYAVADFAANFAMEVHGYALEHNYTIDEVSKKLEHDKNMFKGKTIIEEKAETIKMEKE